MEREHENNVDILITNIRDVVFKDMCLSVHAISLQTHYERSFIDKKVAARHSMIGYGTSPAWQVFRMQLEDLDYELIEARSPHHMLTDEGPQPLASGALLRFRNKIEFSIIKNFNNEKLDIIKFEGRGLVDTGYKAFYKALYDKTTEYCFTPNMPTLIWTPPSQREMLKEIILR